MNHPILDKPPANFMQVLLWADDAGCPDDKNLFARARELPPTTTLREILVFLGATADDIAAAADDALGGASEEMDM